LQVNLFYFNKLWMLYKTIDTDGDGRVDLEEFRKGIAILELGLSDADVNAEFCKMDIDGGGRVLFDEFCVWYVPAWMLLPRSSGASATLVHQHARTSRRKGVWLVVDRAHSTPTGPWHSSSFQILYCASLP